MLARLSSVQVIDSISIYVILMDWVYIICVQEETADLKHKALETFITGTLKNGSLCYRYKSGYGEFAYRF